MQCHAYYKVHPRLRGVSKRHHDDTAFPDGSLSLVQVPAAYGFQQNAFSAASPVLIGIGSLGGGVNQADIDNACAALGMPQPNIKVLTVGGATNDPSDQDPTTENSLDLLIVAATWWYLTGQAANIVICFGPNTSDGMPLVTQALIDAKCQNITWSWGSAADTWSASDRAALSAKFAAGVQLGVTFFAASGDNSIDDSTGTPTPDYPSADPYVWGVGGTNLVLNADGSIAQESAWGDGNPGDEGGGGGIDPTLPMPTWQKGIVPGKYRGCPDSAAVADPNTGWQVSVNGGWTVVGGTSAASPFTCTVVAALKGMNAKLGGLLLPTLYAAEATAFNDILQGSNGEAATPGWDQATGLGSLNAAGLTAALGC